MEFDIKKIRDVCYDIIDTIEVPESRVAVHVQYEKNSYSEDVEIYFFEDSEMSSFVLNFSSGARGNSYSPSDTDEFVYDVPIEKMIELLKEQCKKWGVMINDYYGV